MSRPKGILNKNKQSLLLRLKKELGVAYDPIIEMAIIATKRDETGEFVETPQSRFNMHSQIAPYVTPKLKQVEHSSEDGSSAVLVQVVKFSDIEIDADDTDTE